MSDDLLTRFSKGSGQIFPTGQLMVDKVGHPYENMMRDAPTQRRVTFSENVNEKVIESNQDLIEPFFTIDNLENDVVNEPPVEENRKSNSNTIEPYSSGSFSQYGSAYEGR